MCSSNRAGWAERERGRENVKVLLTQTVTMSLYAQQYGYGTYAEGLNGVDERLQVDSL